MIINAKDTVYIAHDILDLIHADNISHADESSMPEQIKNIISARPYKDLADFYYRAGVSQPVIESLIFTGAFDQLHAITKGGPINRRDLLLHLSDLIKGPTMSNGLRSQMTLGFDAPALESSGLPDLERDRKSVV